MITAHDPADSIPPAATSPLVWALAVACLVTPLLLAPGIYNFADFPKRVALQFLALFLMASLLAPRTDCGQNTLIFTRTSVLAAAFVLWSLASLFRTTSLHDGLQLTIHWAACAAIFVVAQNRIRTADDLRPIAMALTMSGAVVALLGISQYIFALTWIPQKLMPAATFANKNLAAEFIVLVWPLSLYALFAGRASWRTVSSAAALALMFLFIIFSTSKGAWVSVGVESILLGLWFGREFRHGNQILLWSREKTIITAAALLLVLVISTAGVALHRSRETASRIQSQQTFTPVTVQQEDAPLTSSAIRFILWSNTLEIIKDFPLAGVGVGNFDASYPLYYNKGRLDPQFGELYSPRNAHNDYLQITAELGLIGLAIVFLFTLSVLATIRSLLSSTRPHTRFRTALLAAAMIGGGVNAFFSFPMQLALPPFLMLLFSGALSGMRACEEGCRKRTPAPIARVTILILLLGATAMLGQYHFRGFKAYARYFDTIQFTEAKLWTEAREQGEKALASLPGLGIIHSYIGMAQFKMGHPRQAATSMENALKHHPNSLTILKNSGVALVAAGELGQAASRFIRYNEIKPDVAQVHELLADTYRRMGRTEEALQELMIGADLDPDEGKRYMEVGLIARQHNRYPLAARAFAKAVAIKPDWAAAQYHYGTSLYQLNRKQEGEAHLRRALTLGVDPQTANTIRQIISP